MTMLFQGVSSFFFTLATPFSLLFLLVGINATRVAPTCYACSARNVGATLVVALTFSHNFRGELVIESIKEESRQEKGCA